jgi:hypothetical protein
MQEGGPDGTQGAVLAILDDEYAERLAARSQHQLPAQHRLTDVAAHSRLGCLVGQLDGRGRRARVAGICLEVR